MRGTTPENSGTSKQSQGTTTKSRRPVWCALFAPTATTKFFVQYPASGDLAARVYFSKNQVKPHTSHYQEGYLEAKKLVSIVFFPHCGSWHKTLKNFDPFFI